MLKSVSMTLSQTFFSICITSIRYLTSRSDKYERSNNIDFFIYMEVLLFSLFWVIPNTVLMSSTRSRTYSPVNSISALSCSLLPLKAFLIIGKGDKLLENVDVECILFFFHVLVVHSLCLLHR